MVDRLAARTGLTNAVARKAVDGVFAATTSPTFRAGKTLKDAATAGPGS